MLLIRTARRTVARRNLRAELLRTPRLIVGSGGLSQAGWAASDIQSLDLLRPGEWPAVVPAAGLEAILAEHVWEHLNPQDGALAARTCFRFLRPGGWLRVAVPDGHHPDPQYREWVRPGGTGPGADDHRVLYTHESLSNLFEAAGFEVRLLEHFDSEGQFHFAEWSQDDGRIERSSRFDERNRGGTLAYTSLILDAIKPAEAK